MGAGHDPPICGRHNSVAQISVGARSPIEVDLVPGVNAAVVRIPGPGLAAGKRHLEHRPRARSGGRRRREDCHRNEGRTYRTQQSQGLQKFAPYICSRCLVRERITIGSNVDLAQRAREVRRTCSLSPGCSETSRLAAHWTFTRVKSCRRTADAGLPEQCASGYTGALPPRQGPDAVDGRCLSGEG